MFPVAERNAFVIGTVGFPENKSPDRERPGASPFMDEERVLMVHAA